MNRILVAVLGAILMAGVGCAATEDNDPDNVIRDGGADESSKVQGANTRMDACTHCDGVQTATAAGTCPKCGMAMSPPR